MCSLWNLSRSRLTTLFAAAVRGLTPLYETVAAKHIEVAKLLLAARASPHVKGEYGQGLGGHAEHGLARALRFLQGVTFQSG